MKRRGYRLYLPFFVVLLVLPHVVFAGFGVSPPTIQEENLVRGAKLTKTIYLVQGNPEKDLPAEITIDARDIKDWISFDTGTEFIIPAGVQQFPLKVTISVPENADFGSYTAFIRVKTIPNVATEGGTVAVAVGGRIDVDVTVGDNVIVAFEVKKLDILDIKEGKPLSARVRIDNTGNVPIAPDSATFELFDKFGSVRLAFATADSDQFDKVPAFTEEEITLKFPIDVVIAPGEYWGHVRVYDEEGKQLKELRTVFNVHERTLFDILLVPAIVAISVLVVGSVIWFFIRRRRKKQLASV